MGVFAVPLGVGGPGAGELTPVTAMVDTGSAHSMLPASLLTRLGLAPLERFAYELADGSWVEYDYGMARLGLNGNPERYCPVILARRSNIWSGPLPWRFSTCGWIQGMGR